MIDAVRSQNTSFVQIDKRGFSDVHERTKRDRIRASEPKRHGQSARLIGKHHPIAPSEINISSTRASRSNIIGL